MKTLLILALALLSACSVFKPVTDSTTVTVRYRDTTFVRPPVTMTEDVVLEDTVIVQLDDLTVTLVRLPLSNNDRTTLANDRTLSDTVRTQNDNDRSMTGHDRTTNIRVIVDKKADSLTVQLPEMTVTKTVVKTKVPQWIWGVIGTILVMLIIFIGTRR